MHDVGEAKKSMSHRLMIAPIGTESDSSVAKRAARRAVRDPSVYGHALLDRLRVDGPSARCNLGLVIRKPSFAEPGGALH